MRYKIIFSLVSVLFLSGRVFTQDKKVITGQSFIRTIQMDVEYKYDMPPNLDYSDFEFIDENQNGILEAEEKGLLKIVVTNIGKGVAQDLEANVFEEQNMDPDLKIDGKRKVKLLHPDQFVELSFPIEAGFNVRSAEHKIKISVLEKYGFDMDPAYMILNTLEYQEPKIAFAGYEVIDVGENTAARVQDGQLQLGERVQLKISLQNRGQNIARNVKYRIVSKDMENVYLEEITGDLGDIKINEVKQLGFLVSPNRRIDPEEALPLYLTVSLEKNIGGLYDYHMPVYPNQEPPQPEILEVRANIDKLKNQMARFEYSSKKFTMNVANVKDIRKVPVTNRKRSNAVGVIFGIEHYRELAPAPYAENDAAVMQKYFRDLLGIEEVIVYTSEEAIGLIFEDIFNPDYGELQRAIEKGVTDVFIFYSGHGVPSSNGEQIYLFPSTGKLARLDVEGYNVNKLYENLEKLGARSVNVFIDACFSGESKYSETHNKENLVSIKGIMVKPKLNQPWEHNPNFSVFSSSRFNETSCVFDPSRTGLFTYYLCVGLLGDADQDRNNSITMGELYQYVKNEVQNTSQKISSGSQTPEFHGNKDLVLVKF